jgi:uncharacterized protein YecE (DUF72 family)
MPTHNIQLFYSGTSGLVLPVANKSFYPPEFQNKPRLSYYASLFNSIEINSSFYKIPRPATVRKWSESVPDDFRFTFKLWRGITHNKQLEFAPADIHRFMQVIDQVGNKKGCLLVQFPPSINADSLMKILSLIDCIRAANVDNKWTVALEFRHRTWYQQSIADMISSLNMITVLHDIPSSVTPLNYAVGKSVYLRFHGPGGRYSGSYSDDILQEYSGYISEWLDEGKKVFVYFNNTIGDAIINLAALNQMMS